MQLFSKVRMKIKWKQRLIIIFYDISAQNKQKKKSFHWKLKFQNKLLQWWVVGRECSIADMNISQVLSPEKLTSSFQLFSSELRSY